MAVKGAYWRSSEAEKFPPSTINARFFTHIFYATVSIDPRTHEILLSGTDKKRLRDFTTATKQKHLKSLLCIGEAPNQNAFSKMASSTNSRSNFINSSIEIATTYDFNGLDLCWKYPKSKDMENFGSLFQEWREATTEKKLLLSAFVYFAPRIDASTVYPKTLSDNVDFLNVVCYDYEIEDTTKTAAHALLTNPSHPSKSTSSGITSWIQSVPAKKLVMGLPLYGRTWELQNPSDYKIGAPAIGYGPANGLMEYDAILKYNNENGAAVETDGGTVSTYSHADDDWIGYDTPSTVGTKVKFAKNQGLAGYFFWALGMDAACTLPAKASSTWDN
ncbi:hypothetical protein ACB098_05G222700 [Castanea mollissima]